jgi:hypothetical protein
LAQSDALEEYPGRVHTAEKCFLHGIGGRWAGINQNRAILDSNFLQGFVNLRVNIFEAASAGNVKPKFFAVGFHIVLLRVYTTYERFYPVTTCSDVGIICKESGEFSVQTVRQL